MYDLPIESVSFPHGQLEAEPTSGMDVEVSIIGVHPKNGSYGTIRDLGDLDRDGSIISYVVQLHGEECRQTIPVVNLKRWVHDFMTLCQMAEEGFQANIFKSTIEPSFFTDYRRAGKSLSRPSATPWSSALTSTQQMRK